MAEEYVTLDEFSVVARPNKGVWIVDDDGNCWHVGGPSEGAADDNKLIAAYREAVGKA